MQQPMKIAAVFEVACRAPESIHRGCGGLFISSRNSTDPVDAIGLKTWGLQRLQLQGDLVIDQLDQLLARRFCKIGIRG